MPTDPTTAWIIALVVCTIYGWVMYRRGGNAARTETVEIIGAAMELKNGMKLPELLQIVDEYHNHIEEQERRQDADEE